MSRKALHDLNPHQFDEYSSRNAQASGEKRHHYYKRTREGRMNSEPSGEKQHHYYNRTHEGRMNSEPYGEKQHHYYQRSHEGRMNSEPYGEKQQHYYQRSHEGRMNAEPSGQHSYKRRHEESKSIPDADAFALKRQRRPPPRFSEGYGHDHSKCLIARQNRLDEPLDFHQYLFPSKEGRLFPLLSTLPSKKMKRTIEHESVLPPFDKDRFVEESLKVLADHLRASYARLMKILPDD